MAAASDAASTTSSDAAGDAEVGGGPHASTRDAAGAATVISPLASTVVAQNIGHVDVLAADGPTLYELTNDNTLWVLDAGGTVGWRRTPPSCFGLPKPPWGRRERRVRRLDPGRGDSRAAGRRRPATTPTTLLEVHSLYEIVAIAVAGPTLYWVLDWRELVRATARQRAVHRDHLRPVVRARRARGPWSRVAGPHGSRGSGAHRGRRQHRACSGNTRHLIQGPLQVIRHSPWMRLIL